MFDAQVGAGADFDGWRRLARAALRARIAPDDVAWREADTAPDLQARQELQGDDAAWGRVPPAFVNLARQVICHRSPERFALLYRLLWRITHGERSLLEICTDPDVCRAEQQAKSVRRDQHKMKAFVRFRQVAGVEPEQFVAWFEPDHHIVEATAPFFQRRFFGMRWSILTPVRSVHWAGSSLRFGAGTRRQNPPAGDALEELWRTYYAHIFNPARLKVQAMRAEMPLKYWRNLPEAELIAPLVREARPRAERMMLAEPSNVPAKAGRWARRAAKPPGGTNPRETLNEGPAACRRCSLHLNATQAVPGEGPLDAQLMMVGEQPGDQEDLAGRPFVGPAGRLVDDLMAAAGIERNGTFLTNAVKHFRFQPRGKRRMHQKPGQEHIVQCKWWLQQELAQIRPAVVVALGATAAAALVGRPVPMADLRGRILPFSSARLVVTYHPAYVLRLRGLDEQARARAVLKEDLMKARRLLLGAADS